MFTGLSNVANSVDSAFLFVFGLDAIVLVMNTAFMIYCCIRYSRKRNPVATNIHGSVALEVTWTLIPTILVMMMFWVGLGFNREANVPDDAVKIDVVAQKWTWGFTYETGKENDVMNYRWTGEPNDRVVPILTIPVGKAVQLRMTSVDVLHSLYIPAFRVKKDILPGDRYTTMWFTANKVGMYDLFCTEYCGQGHSKMYAKVKVVEQAEFDKWLNSGPKILRGEELIAAGKTIYQQKCTSCHMLNGQKLVGPALNGIFGKKVVLEDGSALMRDESYVIESINMPQAKVVQGYPANGMVAQNLKGQKLDAVVAFLKNCKTEGCQ